MQRPRPPWLAIVIGLWGIMLFAFEGNPNAAGLALGVGADMYDMTEGRARKSI